MTTVTIQHEETLVSVREELKQWEREFSAQNGGRKPSQDDIRSDADISARYRQYNKLKRSQSQSTHTPRKSRRRIDAAERNPTILQDRHHNIRPGSPQKVQEEEVAATEPEILPTPAFIRCALGPTPQKDGQLLGIFDFMPSVTPSKKLSSNTQPTDTPSKPTSQPLPNSTSDTPRSSVKRSLFDAFTNTPRKGQRDTEHDTPSTSRRQFATPSFLRRNFFMPSIAEHDEQPSRRPFQRRAPVRSLSSMIQGLRSQEEQRLDEELDILAELEAEETGAPPPKRPKTLVADSQEAEMPLGPDQGDAGSEDDEGVDPRDAREQPRKPWKKKGLKRQTKRVIMRPVVHKPSKPDSQPERVPETQVDPSLRASSGAGEGGDAAYEDDDGGDEGTEAPGEKGGTEDKARREKGDGVVKKAVRKVSATAHANFRKLKIKNKNSKANGRGRFGKRR